MTAPATAPALAVGARGYVATDGWGGVSRWPVEVVRLTRTRAEVRFVPCGPLCDIVRAAARGDHLDSHVHEGMFPGTRYARPGATLLVPRHHVRVLEAAP